MLALVTLNMGRELGVGSDEHRFLPLTEIEQERVIGRMWPHAAFDGCARIGWQILFDRRAEVIVDDERLALFAHQGHE